MAERLKSISKRISWSSLLKAAVFAAAWWALPYLAFLIVALYLYYVPIAGAGKVSAPFWVLMLLAFLEPQGWIFAIVFGAVFYLMLLIKDLLIIDRRTAYEVLVFVLSYLMMRGFYLNLGGGGFSGWPLLGAMGVALVLTFLFQGFVRNSLPPSSGDVAGGVNTGSRAYRRATGWIVFMLAWQLLIVGLFLPLNFFSQTAIVFLIVTALMSILSMNMFGELNRVRVLTTSLVVFAFLTIVLASAVWTL